MTLLIVTVDAKKEKSSAVDYQLPTTRPPRGEGQKMSQNVTKSHSRTNLAENRLMNTLKLQAPINYQLQAINSHVTPGEPGKQGLKQISQRLKPKRNGTK